MGKSEQISLLLNFLKVPYFCRIDSGPIWIYVLEFFFGRITFKNSMGLLQGPRLDHKKSNSGKLLGTLRL